MICEQKRKTDWEQVGSQELSTDPGSDAKL
jgi:hypothetical protein